MTLRFPTSILLASLVLAVPACTSDTSDESVDVGEAALETTEIVGTLQYGETSAPVAYTSAPRFRAFAFTAKAGDVVDARVTSKDGDANAWILNARSGRLAHNDDESATSRDAHVSFVAPQDGTYYVAFVEKALRKARFVVTLEGRPSKPLPPPPAEQDLASLIDPLCNGVPVTEGDWATAPVFTTDPDTKSPRLSYAINGQYWFRMKKADGGFERWTYPSLETNAVRASYDPATKTVLLAPQYGGQVYSTVDGCSSGYDFRIPFTASFVPVLTAGPASGSITPSFEAWSENANYQGRCYHTTAGLGSPYVSHFKRALEMDTLIVKATATCFAAAVYVDRAGSSEAAYVFATR